MPLYEYQCDACSHRFERIQKFSDPHADTCPKCGGAVHKLLSSPAIQFKGTGWYITDYAKKSSTDSGKNNNNSSASSSSDSASSSSSDKSSDKANSTGSGSSASGSGSASSSGGSSSGSGSSS